VAGHLRIVPLTSQDAETLASFLRAQTDAYMQYFIPFRFDEAVIRGLLETAKEDVYYGLFLGEALAGFFMLRGWDAGYDVPAYGVTIGESFQGLGLGRVTLDLAKAISRLRGAKRIMLKVHPANHAAKALYESAGFQQTGIDPKNDNLIYHYDL
jgi:RimJ/RimL family protein N-acetyltransferase